MATRTKFVLLLSVLLFNSVTSSSVIINENGGYEQIVVAISPKIERSKVENLLLDLEDVLTRASRFLYASTRNLAFFQEIVILLPKTFQDITLPASRVSVVERKNFSSPDVFLERESTFGSRPFTIQNSGCGEPGLFIKVPASFLTGEERLDSESKARVFIHEWGHYRYGVFDEHGFFGDKIYPLVYSVPGQRSESNLQVTSCVNEKVPFVLRKSSGERCQEVTDECFPVLENSEDILSSVMYDPALPKISRFCDGENFHHDRDAPTKQNSLCREESTWGVISRHKDFEITRKTGVEKNNLVPSFKYVAEPDPKVVLVVEATNKMVPNDKMVQVQNAFSYFVLYDLPANSKVGIVSMKPMNSSATKPLFVKLTSDPERERLCDAFPDPYGGGEICVHCGIFQGLQVLMSERRHKASGTLILATITDVSVNWIENITQELDKNDVKLFVISYSEAKTQVPLLEKLAVISGGQLFLIPEISGQASFHSPLTVLYEAFRTIYGSLSWTYEQDATVTQKVFHGSSFDDILSFNIDENIDSFRSILTVPSYENAFPVLKDEVILRHDDSTEYRAGDPAFFYKSKIPAHIFTVLKPKFGNWTLRFKRKPSYKKYIAVIIRASQQTQKSVTVRSWVKPLDGKDKPPGIIYTEVLKGDRPILNANVTALVVHPNVNQVSSFDLRDSGEGDPDITRNDGIYSRYLTDASLEGYYTLSVLVRYSTDEDLKKREADVDMNATFAGQTLICCGSSIPADNSSLSGDFTREHIFGSFYVKGNRTYDSIPPRRIVDLKVINIQWLRNGVKHFTLQWTAPGDDYDYGSADVYEIKVFNSRDDALDSFESGQVLTVNEWNLHGPWLQPEPSGTVQTTIIELSDISSGTYFLAMRAVDSSGNKADVSNVVKVYHDEPKPVEFSTVTSHTFDPDNPFTNGISESTTHAPYETVKTTDLGVVIGITCGLLFLMIIIAFVLLVCFARHRKLQEKNKNVSDSSPRFEGNRNASNDTLCRSVTSSGQDNESISVISPVGSWPAATLLSHYEKVQEARLNNQSPYTLKRERDAYDSISQNSSLYASIHRNPEKNLFMYNSMCYRNPPYSEIENYPFNPAYTSSLRRLHGQDNLSSRLNTDV